MIRHSKFSVSPACHNQVTWLATSAQQLTLLAVARSKQLCQAPRPWRHNATPRRRHLQNIAGFRNLELDTLSDVKSTGKYWLNFVILHHWIRIKLCSCVIQSTRSPSGSPRPGSARRPRTPHGRSDGPYHVAKQFYDYIYIYVCVFPYLSVTEWHLPIQLS